MAGGDGWRWRGRATKVVVAGVDFSYFFKLKLNFGFWVSLVRGDRGGTQYAKKYPTRKAHIRRKLVLVHWAKKIAQTPKYGFVGKITAKPSSFKTCK